jgi:hypothetical protein
MALTYRQFTGVVCGTLTQVDIWSFTNSGPPPVVGGVYSDGIGYYSVTSVGTTTNVPQGEGPVDTNTNYGSCPGIVSRPFSYNQYQVYIPGTYNIGALCVGVDNLNYHDSYGGLTWWGGPNENEGWCIGTVVPAQTQSTPLGNIGNVKFWRSPNFTDSSFLNLVKQSTGQTFTDTPTACAYLASINYWTSFNNLTVKYFVVSNRTSAAHYWNNNLSGYHRPNTTPSYILYSKPTPAFNENWTRLTQDYVGSPAKFTYGGSGPQYTYGAQGPTKNNGFWLTDVWAYKYGSTIAYAFPFGGTDTYGTTVYQNIVSSWV